VSQPLAVLSADGRYRYLLTRDTGCLGGDGTVTFVMLNPSTADAETDDATIRRCKGFALRWGFARLLVVNLFALRGPDPGILLRVCDAEAEGPTNVRHIIDAITEAKLVVAAWGSWHPSATARPASDVVLITWGQSKPLRCLGKTKDGSPRHPLYVRADKALEVWP
jgi:hypothetical protein